MRIEDELKTSSFLNEIQKAQLHIIFCAGWIRNRINSRLKPFGITFEQFNVLSIVLGKFPESIMVKEITLKMPDRNSNTTRIIDKLITKKLVSRLPSEKDGRARSILLTASGQALMLEIDQVWANNSPYQSALNNDQANLLNKLLEQLRD
ncbi:MAG: MarR family transcriptional regulator [Saprospiraceae bacterium]|nr:MarR family transcriptional regulator [Saprospiraceae bacterium]